MTATTGTDDRRFRTRADAFYVRHDGGVWLRNNVGSFSIRGAGAYELVGSLFANLDGERTLDDICAGLPDGARRSVLRLVDTLSHNGFVQEVRYPPEPVPDWMAELYPAHLAFLDHHADRPVTRLTRVRSRQVVCAGDGLALRGLVGALGEFGIARLVVLTTSTGAAGIADLIERAVAADPRLSWHTVVVGDRLDLDTLVGRPELAGTGHLLLATDQDRRDLTDDLAGIQHRLAAAGVAVGILGRCGDYVVAAPPPAVASDGTVDWCWDCVRRSVRGTVAGVAGAAGGGSTGGPGGLAPAVVPATMAALHLAQHLFARLAEVRPDGAATITTVEPVAPVVRTHTARRHPACSRHRAPDATPPAPVVAPADGVVRPDVPASQDPPELVEASDRIVAVTTAWTDPVVGPLLALGEGDGDQLPLSVSTCRLADPAPAAGEPAVRDLLCRAVSPREARNQVVLAALEWTATRLARRHDGLLTGRVLAAGWTRDEAVYRARLAAAATTPAGEPDWRPAEGGPPGPLREFLTGSLAAAGRAWRDTAVETLPCGAVRALVRDDDGRTATGTGLDTDHAIDTALLRALADAQPGPAALALLAPPTTTWAAALHRLDDGPVADLGHLLPFLAGHAHLVAVEAAGAHR